MGPDSFSHKVLGLTTRVSNLPAAAHPGLPLGRHEAQFIPGEPTVGLVSALLPAPLP